MENTGRARCPLLLFLCFVLFFKFTAPLFNFSVSLAGPSLPSPFAKKRKPCLWVRLPGPCLDSAGQATVCPRYSEGSAGTASGGGLRRGYPPKKNGSPGGRPLRVPAHGLLSHSYCLHVSSPPLSPVPSTVYSFTSLTFILPASPRVLFLCVSPPRAMRRRCQG